MKCVVCKENKEKTMDFGAFHKFIVAINPEIKKEELVICDGCFEALKEAFNEFKIKMIADKLGAKIKGKINATGGWFGALEILSKKKDIDEEKE